MKRVTGSSERPRIGEHCRGSSEKAEHGRLHRSRLPGDQLSFAGHWPCQESRHHGSGCKYNWTVRTCVTHADPPRGPLVRTRADPSHTGSLVCASSIAPLRVVSAKL